MSFIRIDQDPAEAPDVLDRALAMAMEKFAHLPGNAQIGPASSLIRRCSAVAQAGGSRKAQAAALLIDSPSTRVDEDTIADVRARVGDRVADLVLLCHNSGPPREDLEERISLIFRRGDDDAKILLEVIALREAGLLARSPALTASRASKTVAALHRICNSPYVTATVAKEIRLTLEGAGFGAPSLKSVEHRMLGTVNDPRRSLLGFCHADSFRPYLTWHSDLGQLLENLAEIARITDPNSVRSEIDLAVYQQGLQRAAGEWRCQSLADEDAAAEAVRLCPGDFEWMGPLENLLSGDDDTPRDIREWYWDDDAKNDAIPDRLVEDFITVVATYGDM